MAAPALCLLYQAVTEVARARLERRRDDAPDADWATIDSGGSPEATLALALDALQEIGLWHAAAAGRSDAGSIPS